MVHNIITNARARTMSLISNSLAKDLHRMLCLLNKKASCQ